MSPPPSLPQLFKTISIIFPDKKTALWINLRRSFEMRVCSGISKRFLSPKKKSLVCHYWCALCQSITYFSHWTNKPIKKNMNFGMMQLQVIKCQLASIICLQKNLKHKFPVLTGTLPASPRTHEHRSLHPYWVQRWRARWCTLQVADRTESRPLVGWWRSRSGPLRRSLRRSYDPGGCFSGRRTKTVN